MEKPESQSESREVLSCSQAVDSLVVALGTPRGQSNRQGWTGRSRIGDRREESLEVDAECGASRVLTPQLHIFKRCSRFLLCVGGVKGRPLLRKGSGSVNTNQQLINIFEWQKYFYFSMILCSIIHNSKKWKHLLNSVTGAQWISILFSSSILILIFLSKLTNLYFTGSLWE